MIPDLAVDVLRITDHLGSQVHESCMLKTICLWNYMNINDKTVFFMVYLSKIWFSYTLFYPTVVRTKDAGQIVNYWHFQAATQGS